MFRNILVAIDGSEHGEVRYELTADEWRERTERGRR